MPALLAHLEDVGAAPLRSGTRPQRVARHLLGVIAGCFRAGLGRALPLTIVNAEFRVMTANLSAGRAAEQAEVFAGLIDQPRDGGCELAALTSMGGHFCIDELKARRALPLVDAVEGMSRHLVAGGFSRVGVLGTSVVMRSGLYGMAGPQVVAPAEDELERVGDAYISVATVGAATPRQRTVFRDAAARLVEQQGVEAIVLGATDLSVALDASDVACPVIDSAVVHAGAIAEAVW